MEKSRPRNNRSPRMATSTANCDLRSQTATSAPEESTFGRRVASGAFWSFLGTGFSRAAAFVALILVARILGRETFGQFGLIRSTAMTFVAFSSFGMGLTATKYVAALRCSDPRRSGAIIGLSYFVTLISSLTVALVFYASAGWLCETRLAAPHLADPMRLGALLLFLATFSGTQVAVMTGFQDFRGLAAANLVSASVSIPIYIFAALRFGLYGALGAAVTVMALHLIANGIFVRSNMKKYGISVDVRQVLRELSILWSSNLPVVLSSVIVALSSWIPQLLLGSRPGGVSELGVYHIVLNLQAIVFFLPQQLSPVLFPMLSELGDKKNDTRFRRVAWKGWGLSFVAALLTALPFILLPKEFLAWCGPEYLDGAVALRVACLAVLASTGGMAMYSALIGKGRFWLQFTISVFSTAATILSAATLVHAGFGAAGLFLAQTLGATLFVALGLLFFFQKRRVT